MLRKRLIGVVTVRRGLAVQSFGYRRYLPLGRPEIVVENLDRWGADEILVQVIDRSLAGAGPDLGLLERLGALGLSTPLIYGGGIRDASDAVQVVRLGADRVAVDAMLRRAPDQLEATARELGAQALIAHLPVRMADGALLWRDHLGGAEAPLSRAALDGLPLDWASEVMLTDWPHEGMPEAFEETIPVHFPPADKPLILFGGLSSSVQLSRMLALPSVAAVCVGNFLNYREHAVQALKAGLDVTTVREADFQADRQP